MTGTGTPDLVVVTDRRLSAGAGRGLAETVAAAVEGGAKCVLLREKDLPAIERRRLAHALLAVLGPAGAGLIVAGDPALAAEAGGAAVHLAAADPWPSRSSRSAPPGRSCHCVAELRAARDEGAAYVTLSPVFPSASKPGYGPALGLDGLAAACAAVPGLPVLALGGVGPGRAAGCIGAGARGVAVMGAVMRASDPTAVVRHLVGELAGVAS